MQFAGRGRPFGPCVTGWYSVRFPLRRALPTGGSRCRWARLIVGEPTTDGIVLNYFGVMMFGLAWLMWVGGFASATREGRTVRFDRVDPFDDGQR